MLWGKCMKKARNVFLQGIRGICIIAVILIHSRTAIGYETTFIYDYWLILRQVINFPVAVFFFLSGYFTYSNDIGTNWGKYYAKRIKRLLIPYLIWTMAYTFIVAIFNPGYLNFNQLVINIFLGKAAGHLYFIVVLLQLVLFTPLIIRFINNKMFWLTIIVSCIIFYFVYYLNYFYQWKFSGYSLIFLAWIPFYMIGLYIKSNTKLRFNKSLIFSVSILIIALLLSVAEGYFLKKLNMPASFQVSQIKVSSLIYSISMINLVMVLDRKVRKSDKKQNILPKLGDMSLGIYYIHMIYIIIFNKFWEILSPSIIMLPIIHIVQLLFTIIASIITIYINKKIFGRNMAAKLFGF